MASGPGVQDWPPATGLAAVGPATAAELQRAVRPPDVVAPEATAAALAAAVPPPEVPGDAAVLFPRAERVSPVLADGLRAMGWVVDEVVAYRTVAARPDPSLLAAVADADIVTFTSPSTVAGFAELVAAHAAPGGARPQGGAPLVACIGPTTAAAASSAGMAVAAVADRHDAAGLVDAVVALWARRAPGTTRGEPGRPTGTEHGATTTPGDLP
jgi:uroporphyrinogen-III synthase